MISCLKDWVESFGEDKMVVIDALTKVSPSLDRADTNADSCYLLAKYSRRYEQAYSGLGPWIFR